MMRQRWWRLTILATAVVVGAALWLHLFLNSRHVVGERTEVALHFISTRDRVEGSEPKRRFGGERGETRAGVCRVESTRIPITEAIAERADFYVPSRDRRVLAVDDGPLNDTWRALAAEIGPTAPVVLFVHGYYYDFARVCLRGAGLKQMLADQAGLLMFTWPSDGSPEAYVADLADIEWSVPQLAGVIRELDQRFGADRVRLVAHSLGTRGVLEALARLRIEGVTGPVAGQLVLLAPDYDADAFIQQLPLFRAMVGDITVYASEFDTPLQFSQRLHGQPRLGQGGAQRTVAAEFETVDVSPLGRYQLSGHEYFHFHPVASSDLVTLLVRNLPAAERPLTEMRQQDGMVYWVLRDPR